MKTFVGLVFLMLPALLVGALIVAGLRGVEIFRLKAEIVEIKKREMEDNEIAEHSDAKLQNDAEQTSFLSPLGNVSLRGAGNSRLEVKIKNPKLHDESARNEITMIFESKLHDESARNDRAWKQKLNNGTRRSRKGGYPGSKKERSPESKKEGYLGPIGFAVHDGSDAGSRMYEAKPSQATHIRSLAARLSDSRRRPSAAALTTE